MPSSISPAELAEALQRDQTITLIDVRTPAEFQEIHLSAARNIPLHQLEPELVRERYSNKPIYVICQKGGRGKQACERLAAAGVPNVVNIEGGAEACVAAGLPVVRGRQVMALERQVRVAAGSLVLLGIILAWLIHPALIALSAFVGAGLVFSGITDTCGMGMLLARMPWNQTNETCSDRTNSRNLVAKTS